MSDTESNTPPQPQNDGLDLSSLRMMPAWVGDFGKEDKIKERFADYEERPQRGDRNDRRGGGGFGDRRPAGGGGARPAGGAPRRDGPGGPPRGDRRPSGGGGGDREQRGGPRRFGDRDRGERGRGRDDAAPQREWQPIPQDVQVTIYPEDKALDTLAQHVRNTGHAFSMFDAARLVLSGGDRYHVRFKCADTRPTPLFQTTADGGLFLSRDEAVAHLLNGPAFETYYRVEDIELEAPKGDFKSVAICGMSGTIIGPPSHHSYQTSVIRLHRERFGNMALEDYKRRIRVDSSPEMIDKWKEQASKGRRWVYLKGETAEGAEPVTFATRAEVDGHFRRMHSGEAVVEVRDANVSGNVLKENLSHVLFIMLRQSVDGARKHLFDISQKLSAGLERRGLKMFKRRSGKMFVSRVRPRAMDPSVVFSAPLAKIVEFLKNGAGMHLHQLVEAIAPSPPRDDDAPVSNPAELAKPTQQQVEVIKDIRWLANEGYVIEYSDGMIFLGVQGEPVAVPQAKKAESAVQSSPVPAKEATAAVPPPAAPASEIAPAAAPVIEALEDVFE
jgi:hypothetical protein